VKNIPDKTAVLVHGAGHLGFYVTQILRQMKKCEVIVACDQKDFKKVQAIGGQPVNRNDLGTLPVKFFSAAIDVTSEKDLNILSTLSVPLLKEGARFITVNGTLVSNIDQQGEVLTGTINGASDLAKNKFHFFTSHKMEYEWAYFTPDPEALTQLVHFIEKGTIQPLQPILFSIRDFDKGLHCSPPRGLFEKVVFDMRDIE
jgi:NADPH:quinone reductase-like Zn-dependent oxidoreductase